MSSYSAQELYTSKQTAKRLGIAEITLKNWRARGVGPPPLRRRFGNAYMYLRATVDQWREEHIRVGPRGPFVPRAKFETMRAAVNGSNHRAAAR